MSESQQTAVMKDASEQIDTTGKGGKTPCDLYGKPFRCAVDAEHKATELQICSFALPHMRCFHASWMGFFATFAPAPLAAYLKRDDTLALTSLDIGNGNIASVAVTIIGRGLATFVCCQVWCSQQFSKNVVGAANATAAG